VSALGCDKYETKATIKYSPPFDGCGDYMIKVETDQTYTKYYKPDNLPDEFKIDNLPIEVTFSITEEKYDCKINGIHSIIHIKKIRKL
jgi:ssDNA-binding Zn-finger/Zn-ribbon topoisomerase 1